MKKKISLLFTFVVMMCLMVCLSVNVSAAEVATEDRCGENAYWSFDESTGTLTISGTGKIDDAVVFDDETGEILIDENTGEPVFNMPWYHLKNQIDTIVIEEGITEIGALAFYSFYNLTEVDFPSTLEVVGCAAFCDCIKLEELDFPNSVKTLYVSNYNEIAVKKIVLPESLEAIPTIPGIDGIFDFNMCAYLESITVPEEIGDIEVTVDGSNPSIRNIYNRSMDAIVKFDEHNNMWYGDEATAEYMTVTIGAALASIEYEMTDEEREAFVLEKIKEYYGEDYVEKIPEPVYVENVPDYIKVYCYENSAQHLYCVENNINFVLIDSHTHLDSDNDGNCDICGEIFVVNEGNCGENATYKLYSDGTLIIDGEGDMWNFAYVGEDDLFGMPEYMTWAYEEIDGEMCLAGDKTIKKVIVSDGITRIGNYAFQACRALEEVEIADTVTSIGEAAFDFCTSLKHIRIPGSVKILEQEAFSESALETIEIEEGLERIETLAFFYCRSLKEVNLPESVEYIGDFAFIICDKLETLVINNKACEIGLEILMTGELDEDGNIIEDENGNPIPTECPTVMIGYSGSTAEEYANTWTEAGYPIKFVALDSHSHLDSDNDGNCDICGEIFIVGEGNCGANGDNVTWKLLSNGNLTISGNGAIADNYSKFGKLYIRNVIIESGVTTIGSWAFARCDDLESIEIPDTVTNIGDSAFSGCSSLKAVSLPAGVTNIGTAAFFNCKSLESIVIPDGITSIAELTFCGCKNLTNVSIKKSVTYVGKKAFDGCTRLALVDYESTEQDWYKISVMSGNEPLNDAEKNFGAVCRHTEDGHETEYREEIIDEATFFDEGSYEEIITCKNCGKEISRERKTIPEASLQDVISESFEELFDKGPISAIANLLKRLKKLLRIK